MIFVCFCSTASDGHDKPFCTKAITIINNFKKAFGDIDKLSPMNFSNKCCDKFLMRLTKFLQVTLQKCVSRFFKKRMQFTDSAVVLNKTKRDVLISNYTLGTQCIFSIALIH